MLGFGSSPGVAVTLGQAFAISLAIALNERLNLVRLLVQIISFPVETFRYTTSFARMRR